MSTMTQRQNDREVIKLTSMKDCGHSSNNRQHCKGHNHGTIEKEDNTETKKSQKECRYQIQLQVQEIPS